MADIKVGLDARSFNTEMAKVDKKLDGLATKSKKSTDKVESNFSKLKKSVFSLKGALIGLGSAFAIKSILTNIITIGAEFEKTMKIVQGVSRATEEQFKSMNEVAKQLGETTEFTATQAAEGLRFLTMAGIEATQAIAALPGVLDLATAGNLELGESADIASNAMTAMGLGAEDLSRINDSFIATTTRSNSTVRMLAESFRYVAPTANALGYDIERMNALLGKLHDSGIQGSMAGTQLNQALLRSQKLMAKMGMEGDVIDLLKRMNDEMWSVDDIMQKFAGRGGRAILVLKGMVGASDEAAGSIQKLEKDIRNATGEAEDLAVKMRDTTIGAFKELQSVIEGIALGSFEDNMGGFKNSIKGLTEEVRDSKDEFQALGQALLNLAEFGVKTIAVLSRVYDWGNLAYEVLNDVDKINLTPKMQFELDIKNAEKKVENLQEKFDRLQRRDPTSPKLEVIAKSIMGWKEQVVQSGKVLDFYVKMNKEEKDRVKNAKEIEDSFKASEKLFGIQAGQYSLIADKEKIIKENKIKTLSLIAKEAETQALIKKQLSSTGELQKKVNGWLNDSLNLYTQEEKKINSINKLFDDEEKRLSKIYGTEVDISKQRTDAIDLVKLYFETLNKAEGKEININEILKERIGYTTQEEKDLKAINEIYDKQIIKNKNNLDKIKELNKERGKALKTIKDYHDSALDNKQIYEADEKHFENIGKHQNNLIKAKIQGEKEYQDQLKETENKIKRISQNIGENFTQGLKAGIEGGFDGALDHIKNNFINAIGGLISDTVSNTIGKSISSSLVSSNIGSGLSQAIGTIGGVVGGVAGAGVGMGVDLITNFIESGKAKEKAERETSRQYIKSLNDLRESIEKNIIALERQTAADYKSHDWSEKMWEAQKDRTEKSETIGERPTLGNLWGDLSRRKEEIREWELTAQKIEDEYLAVMKSLRVDIIRDSEEIWKDLNNEYLSTFQIAQNGFKDKWTNIVDGFMDSLVIGEDGPIKETEKFKNLVGGIDDPIEQFKIIAGNMKDQFETISNMNLEELFVDFGLSDTDFSNPEMEEAIRLLEILIKDEIAFERKRFQTIQNAIKSGEEYTQSIRESTAPITALDSALESAQNHFHNIGATIREQDGTYEDLKENISNMHDSFDEIANKMNESAKKIKDGDVNEYLRELRGEITPLEKALDSMNTQFDSWEEDIRQLTNEENSLSLQRLEAEMEINKLYDAEGNLITTTSETSSSITELKNEIDDLSKGAIEALKGLNDMADRMKSLKEETFDKLFEDLEFKESGLSREDWVQKEIDRLFSLPALTEEEFSKAMGYVEEWYGFATDATQEQLEVIDAWDGVINKIKDLSNSIVSAQRDIRSSELNVAVPIKKLEDITPDYNELLKAAKGGDEAALNEYLSFASQYLQIAQDTFKSSEQYQSIYEQVMKDMDDLNTFIQSDDFAEKIYNETQTTNDELSKIDSNLDSTNLKLTSVRSELQSLRNKADQLSVTIDGVVTVHLASSSVEFGSTIVEATPTNIVPKEVAQFADMDLSEQLAFQSSFPSYGTGGVIQQPTFATVGEVPEAIIPLQNGAVPVRISGGMDNNKPINIIVEIGGEQFYTDIEKIADDVRVKAEKRNAGTTRIYQ